MGCLNIIKSKEQNIQQIKQEMVDVPINIKIMQMGNNAVTSVDVLDIPYSEYLNQQPLDYNSYIQLKQQFGDTFIIGYSVQYMESLKVETQTVLSQLLYINTEQFEMSLDKPMAEKTIYATEEIYNILNTYVQDKKTLAQKIDMWPDTNTIDHFTIKNGQITIYNSFDKLNLEKITQHQFEKILLTTKGAYYIEQNQNSPIKNGILLPDKYISGFESQYIDRMVKFYTNKDLKTQELIGGGTLVVASPLSCDLNLKYKNVDFDENALSQILMYLNDNDYGYSFTVENEYGRLQQQIEYFKILLIGYQMASIGVLVISVCCNIGVTIVQVSQRKKAMAVAKAYGAKNVQIAIEIFLELFIVNGIGVMLAVLAVYLCEPLMQKLDITTQVMMYDNLVVAILFALICSVLPMIYAVFSINKIQPAQILKEE